MPKLESAMCSTGEPSAMRARDVLELGAEPVRS